jgi:hypothetical protein
MLTIIKLADVNGEPLVKLDLPGPLRNGDPVALRFILSRQTGGRSEVLEVDGRFLVRAVGFDATVTPPKQLLSLETVGRVPTWRSVKKLANEPRRLGPTRFPRTPVG